MMIFAHEPKIRKGTPTSVTDVGVPLRIFGSCAKNDDDDD